MRASDTNDRPLLISCLHLSRDEITRHVAVAVLSARSCALKVWRIENPPEDPRQRQLDDRIDFDYRMNVTITFTDGYSTSFPNGSKRVIKVQMEFM